MYVCMEKHEKYHNLLVEKRVVSKALIYVTHVIVYQGYYYSGAC